MVYVRPPQRDDNLDSSTELQCICKETHIKKKFIDEKELNNTVLHNIVVLICTLVTLFMYCFVPAIFIFLVLKIVTVLIEVCVSHYRKLVGITNPDAYIILNLDQAFFVRLYLGIVILFAIISIADFLVNMCTCSKMSTVHLDILGDDDLSACSCRCHENSVYSRFDMEKILGMRPVKKPNRTTKPALSAKDDNAANSEEVSHPDGRFLETMKSAYDHVYITIKTTILRVKQYLLIDPQESSVNSDNKQLNRVLIDII